MDRSTAIYVCFKHYYSIFFSDPPLGVQAQHANQCQILATAYDSRGGRTELHKQNIYIE